MITCAKSLLYCTNWLEYSARQGGKPKTEQNNFVSYGAYSKRTEITTVTIVRCGPFMIILEP